MDVPPLAEPAAEHAPVETPSPVTKPLAETAAAPLLEIANSAPREDRGATGRDLYRSGNRRLIYGPMCGVGAGGLGLLAMGVWTPDFRFGSAAFAVSAEGFAISSFALLASGARLQRRAQLQFGVEPERNPWIGAGYALGGGALLLGALTPGALSTENRPFIYTTTGGAALLGVGGLTAFLIANVQEYRRTAPLARESKLITRNLSLQVGPTGFSGTW